MKKPYNRHAYLNILKKILAQNEITSASGEEPVMLDDGSKVSFYEGSRIPKEVTFTRSYADMAELVYGDTQAATGKEDQSLTYIFLLCRDGNPEKLQYIVTDSFPDPDFPSSDGRAILRSTTLIFDPNGNPLIQITTNTDSDNAVVRMYNQMTIEEVTANPDLREFVKRHDGYDTEQDVVTILEFRYVNQAMQDFATHNPDFEPAARGDVEYLLESPDAGQKYAGDTLIRVIPAAEAVEMMRRHAGKFALKKPDPSGQIASAVSTERETGKAI